MKNLKIVIGIFAVIIAIFIAAKIVYRNSDVVSEGANPAQAAILEVRANDWVVGDPNAKATLVEYLDFECEVCGAYYPVTKKLQEEYKDSIRFVVRYLPLPGHKNSRTAAYAVEAAGKQGKFWEMYSLLYERQSEWGEQKTSNQDQFEKYAIEAGVNPEQWKKDVASPEVKKRVDESYNEALSLNLQGTPSFFLNGKKIENPKGYDAFKKLIDEELAK